jgi:hypothetical protein
MLKKSDITGILIRLEIHSKPAYHVLMDSDGSINRQGSIRKSEAGNDLYIGVADKELFTRLVSFVDDSLLKVVGRKFELKGKNDICCKLTLLFKVGKEDNARGILIEYSSDMNLPADVSKLIQGSYETTQPWYEKAKKKSP